MRKLLVLLVFAVALSGIGCSKDEAAKAFLTELESVSNAMVKEFDAGNIEGARKVFEEKKSSLQSNFDAIKNAREMQVSEEVKKEMTESIQKNVGNLTKSAMSAAMKSNDQKKAEEVKTLLNDFVSVFKL
ncbi:MAG: hypothetical protein R2684_03295 [Pyrinomonadaceae bacterium]